MTERQGIGQRLGIALPRNQRIPTRIRQHIQARQDSSEILIGWVQLGVVCLFGLLYLASPKVSVAFQPTPIALALYLGFTLLRLVLAYRRALPGWMLIVSTIVDVVLLMALIWTFHIQYGQPPSFYLKVPTLLYVFVFISLRALRFEARYVLLAGFAAATGWLVNVGYAIWFDMNHDHSTMMVTRDYVEYMTSNSILVGAELDKIISILVVTLILAFAISRARTTMIQATIDESAAHELSRFVPSEVAQAVTQSNEIVAAGETEQEEGTILFLDIESFTRIGGGLAPEDLVKTLNEFFAVACGPIEELDGVVTQFQGDAILASFNLPKRNPAHAANALRAALRIQKTLATHVFHNDLKLNARIGLNSGVFVGGLVGTAERVSYTVHGDAVNLASRLEQHNKKTGTRILLSQRTYELAGPEALNTPGIRALGSIEIRGHARPMDIYTVDGVWNENLTQSAT